MITCQVITQTPNGPVILDSWGPYIGQIISLSRDGIPAPYNYTDYATRTTWGRLLAAGTDGEVIHLAFEGGVQLELMRNEYITIERLGK